MNKKEMIEEMKQDLIKIRTNLRGCYLPQCLGAYENAMAQDLIDLNYRKIPEGSIVLSAKDIETTCKHCRSKYYKIIEELEEQRDRQAYIAEDLIQEKHRWTEQARKETAKEIYLEMIGEFEPYIATEIAKEIAKKYGVEVEE